MTSFEIHYNPNSPSSGSEQVNANYDERTDTRKGYLHGTYPHILVTRVGNMDSKVLKTPDLQQ